MHPVVHFFYGPQPLDLDLPVNHHVHFRCTIDQDFYSIPAYPLRLLSTDDAPCSQRLE